MRTGAKLADTVAEVVGAEGVGEAGEAAESPAVAPPVVGAAAAAPQHQERPQGVKAAKLETARKRKLDGANSSVDQDANAIMARMGNIPDALEKAQRKQEPNEHHRRGQADKPALSAFSVLYGGAALTLPERLTALSEQRQLYLLHAAGVLTVPTSAVAVVGALAPLRRRRCPHHPAPM